MKTIGKIFLLLCIICLTNFVFCQEIILIRHAKVNLDTKGWMGYGKVVQLNEQYNIAPISKFEAKQVLAELPPIKTDTVYVSNLNRSIVTGWTLFGDSAVVLSSGFLDEFELNIVHLPLRLPYKGWTSVSRALWLLGLNQKNNESFKEAKSRVLKIADFIEDRLNYNEQVVMVTHGFLNRYVARELKKRGWMDIQDHGSKNLGATVLQK